MFDACEFQHLLLHAQGGTLRQLRQLRGLSAVRRRGTGQCSQHIRQTTPLNTTVRSPGKTSRPPQTKIPYARLFLCAMQRNLTEFE